MNDPADQRQDDAQQRIAEGGDGLANATQGKQPGEGLENAEDTADGEDASDQPTL